MKSKVTENPGKAIKVAPSPGEGGGGSLYNDLNGEAQPEGGIFLSLKIYKRVGISQVKVSERAGKSVI